MFPVVEKREYTGNYPDKTLYLPGPTEVRDDVIEAMCEPMFGHRMDRMTDLYTTVVEDTREFLDTEQNVVVLSASGTEFWEATTFCSVSRNSLVSSTTVV